MLIEFGHIGSHLGTRFAGATVREKITSYFNDTDKFVFDFAGVETVSKSFADECFAKLIFEFDVEQIRRKTTFKNTSPYIKATIANAYKERLSEVVLA